MKKDWDKSFMSDAEISALYKENEQEAKKVVVAKYSDFIHFVINKMFTTYRRDTADLYQCGVIGLLKALKNYDPCKGKFSTFCMPYIRKECVREIRLGSGEGSEYYHAIHTSVSRAKSALESNGKETTVEEIMSSTNLSRKIVEREMGVDYVTASYDLLENSDFEPAYDSNSAVEEILGGLPKYEQDIVKMRAIDGISFEEIGAFFGRNSYAVEKDYEIAIQKLRRQMA